MKKVTAKKVGSTTITAKVSGKTLSCKVTVPSPVFDEDEIEMNVGETGTIKLSKNAADVEWVTSNDNIEIVSSSKTGAKVTAIEEGEAVIEAKCKGKTVSCNIIVVGTEDE